MSFAILETEGGKLAVIIFMLLFLSGVSMLMVMTGHPPQETGRTLLASAFSSLMALLVSRLGGKELPKA